MLVRPLSWSWSKPLRVAIWWLLIDVKRINVHLCVTFVFYLFALKSWECWTSSAPSPPLIRISFDQIYDVESKGHIEHLNQMKGTNALCYPMPPTREIYLLMFSFPMRRLFSINAETTIRQNTANKKKKKVTGRSAFPSSGVSILLSCAFSCTHFWSEKKKSSRMLKADEGMDYYYFSSITSLAIISGFQWKYTLNETIKYMKWEKKREWIYTCLVSGSLSL